MTAPVSLRAPLFEQPVPAGAAGTAGAVPAPPAPDLAALLGLMWRRAGLLLAAAGLAAGLALAWAGYAMVPRYQATATVLLTPDARIGPVESLLPGLAGNSTVITTEVGILRARSLLARLIETQGLLADPEFNAQLAPPGPVDRLQKWLRKWLRDRLALALPGTGPGPPDEGPDIGAQRLLTIDALAERVSVRNMPDSLIFEVTVETRAAEKSARLANALVRLYIEDQIAAKARATEQAASWLSERVADLRQELETADSRARTFSAQMELVSSRTLVALSAQLKDVRERIARGTALLGQGRETGARDSDRARARLTQLIRLEQDLSARIARQSDDSVALGQYEREAEASRLIYEHFLTRLKETAVQKGLQQADSRMLSPAEPPIAPARPRRSLIALMAGLLGLMLAALTIALREGGRDSFRTDEELSAATGRPVLGQSLRLPRGLFRRRRGVLSQILTRPQSAAAEAIRNLRTSLFLQSQSPPQVVMVTSSLPGEGKTTLTLGLAQNIAGLGRRVLVIEGDIRKRVFASYFPAGARPVAGGTLLCVLKGMPLAEAVRPHAGLKADVLLAAPSRSNPADLLATRQFRDLIADARRDYDCILIDTPPVLAVPDARLVAELADAVLYAVHWDKTSARVLRQGLRALSSARVRLAGLVLTRVDPRAMRRLGYGEEYRAKGYYTT
ncbi:GNVR domain-containing protein [Brevirhabdus sp.]|uniref:GNVR domain-containing protein n=1 Tax=Brevirhabdus sp. TaxID=2004514 RepID=UPI004058C3DC